MDATGAYVPDHYTIKYLICKGIELDMAGYTEITPEFKAKLPKSTKGCKYGIKKDGHDFVEGQCYFSDSNIKVKAGELIGWTTQDDRGMIPFEIWAANYNVPPRSDVNWEYYNDDRYAHSMCTFDLYTGALRDQFYAKLGGGGIQHKDVGQEAIEKGKQPLEPFKPRTVEPRCGQVNQNIPGTLQGMWFGDSADNAGAIEFEGKGLSFIHNNIDPTLAEIGVGGNFMKTSTLLFVPEHTGTMNREFSEVTPGASVYCYPVSGDVAGEKKEGSSVAGKILVRLQDATTLQVEYQEGQCTTSEQLTQPFTYWR